MTAAKCLSATIGLTLSGLLLVPLYLVWVGEESWKRQHPSFVSWLFGIGR